ncbi:MAG TPA: hypothetical protein VD864_00845 [Nocardioides sp.]|nr:hypothetical protein [Nocardioides sp.]
MTAGRAKRGPMRAAVERSAPARNRDARDRGVWTLALRYADLIDRAELLAAAAVELLDPESDLEDSDRKRVAALARAVEAQNVAAELGPKLLDALRQLHLTPAARAVAAKGTPTDAPDPAEQALARLRATRPGAGQHNAPPVDSPAP